MKYHIWTMGCQMNVADSMRLASELERLGYRAADTPDEADVLVVNTCVVRQSAEDKAYGRLMALKGLKEQHPDKIIGLMGCLVGRKIPSPLAGRFPWVDVFMPPATPEPLIDLLIGRGLADEERSLRDALQDGDLLLPERERGKLVATYVNAMQGCSQGCAYCIVPYRRGPERSRPMDVILAEARSLVEQGVKEITLLGQIIDRYGRDLGSGPDLADLLRAVHEIPGLIRLRFLTSHPLWMDDRLLDAVAELPKVCEHIEVPVQAGDDEILARMKRGYTADDYRRLVEKIRARIPDVAIHTDVIVGFPGETEQQFMRTYELLAELRLDKVHIARYSPRPQTLSARKMPDDVPPEEKERRRKALDDLQSQIAAEINSALLGQKLEVLVEGKKKNRWYGRTRTNKLVFFEDDSRDWRGRLATVEITWAGPWSLIGKV